MIGPLAGSEGAFGRVSGSGLKRLPSSVYWAALTRWGILLEPEAALAPVVHRLQDDEAARHPVDAWSPTLPTIPDGFPDEVRDGFDLSLQEASWLRDRMLATVDGSLLTWLLAHRPRESGPFWSDPAISDAPGAIGDLVHHARMFATAMQGASLLYNLLLADDLGRLAVTLHHGLPITGPTRPLGADADAVGLRQWRPDWLWGWVSGQGVRIPPSTRRFVDGWVTQLGLVSGLPDLSDATAARAFIRDRERQHKRSQARIGNRKRLSQWGGSSGAGELQFRWPQVRRILLDIHEGLERDA
ncbi:hypothetical protein G7085_05610 [Tessaracoccus sp. HDW20]|uniref:DUF6361 family protein n=1 Tax=Tessaracoccus coleopterorum TaxID=2714950 RepID=UPI0018D3113A|nr:DUF6361 family protein [Tessaracoccus coleopterorum]NHB84269.1 hypothetical protein [Tessaracoccus coleopterorum]